MQPLRNSYSVAHITDVARIPQEAEAKGKRCRSIGRQFGSLALLGRGVAASFYVANTVVAVVPADAGRQVYKFIGMRKVLVCASSAAM